MVVGAKVCELTDGFLWFVCGLYVGILMSPLMTRETGWLPPTALCCKSWISSNRYHTAGCKGKTVTVCPILSYVFSRISKSLKKINYEVWRTIKEGLL